MQLTPGTLSLVILVIWWFSGNLKCNYYFYWCLRSENNQSIILVIMAIRTKGNKVKTKKEDKIR
jgi:hypothetical protein